ncbi:hypothetical protein HD597_011348 [Nonomuraea thailandensis]|uniref:Uncharacterized protein n=1 Tax=Nonomuraea thailandensis TaxID=1188745 RepID=A0A9X2K8N7_9ACTN|nr:hypothetical protein [Nonomuraea thailandensis]
MWRQRLAASSQEGPALRKGQLSGRASSQEGPALRKGEAREYGKPLRPYGGAGMVKRSPYVEALRIDA